MPTRFSDIFVESVVGVTLMAFVFQELAPPWIEPSKQPHVEISAITMPSSGSGEITPAVHPILIEPPVPTVFPVEMASPLFAGAIKSTHQFVLGVPGYKRQDGFWLSRTFWLLLGCAIINLQGSGVAQMWMIHKI
ncbi:MAG TPA: hypothetical protein VJT33_05670 [bacterium]|nr:hypothetical protein [bacterium]